MRLYIYVCIYVYKNLTLNVAEKYGKCAQSDYILKEDTSAAKLCPVFLIVAFHPLDKPN